MAPPSSEWTYTGHAPLTGPSFSPRFPQQEPANEVWLCTKCGSVWATVKCGEAAAFWLCHHSKCAEHGGGSLWLAAWPERFAAMPDLVVQREFTYLMENPNACF